VILKTSSVPVAYLLLHHKGVSIHLKKVRKIFSRTFKIFNKRFEFIEKFDRKKIEEKELNETTKI